MPPQRFYRLCPAGSLTWLSAYDGSADHAAELPERAVRANVADGNINSVTDTAPDGWIPHWFEFHRLASGTREQRKALSLGQPVEVQGAWDWVEDRIMDGGKEAVDVIAELAEAASTDHEQSLVGIGPVEDLIYGHGDAALAQLFDRARRTPALAAALGWVSLASGSVSKQSLADLAQYQRPR